MIPRKHIASTLVEAHSKHILLTPMKSNPGAQILLCVQDHSSNSSQLRIQALQFLGVALKSTSPAVWQSHVKATADAVIAAAGERYSLVSAEGLRVCESLVYVTRPDPTKAIPPSQKVLQATGRSNFPWNTRSSSVRVCDNARAIRTVLMSCLAVVPPPIARCCTSCSG